MEKHFVFCDESGTPSKNDGISHFVYSAVIISESQIKKARIVRNEISEKFLNGHKISAKSKAIRKNIKKRLNVLEYICSNLDFSVYSLIVDKSEIESKGLDIKKVFIKYFQKLLYGNIDERYTNYVIYMDSSGWDEFQIDLKQYIYKELPKLQANLFSIENKFFLKSDDEEELIQFADLFSNSLLKIYSRSERMHDWESIYEIIESKIFKPQFFPYNSIFSQENEDFGAYKINKEIYQSVLDSTNKISRIDKVENLIIDFLVYYSRILPQKLVETYEIREEINRVLGYDVTTEKIRTHVRDLRYKGILIISKAGKSGYKLAVNEEDISSYFQHYLSYIVPMLEKANIAEESLRLSLDSTSYTKISKFLKALKMPD